MGGTSFDLSLVVDGQPTVSTETELEGLPVLMPLVDIHTIGAGGGSLAWLEAGGLRVGPQSAGADPGPACYGRGGTQPTVTDANLFLGRLDPGYFLGGRMQLDQSAAAGRARRPSRPRSASTTTELAEGMLAIINARMADAMRTITVKQGIDPREYSLVAFGGAGPMHAVWLAEELEIGEVIVPWSPGTFSAWGMLQTDMRHDVVRSFYRPLAELDVERRAGAVRRARAEGAALLEAEDVGAEDRYFARSADMRYVGQEYTVNVAGRRGELARGDRRRRSTTLTASATGTRHPARRSSSSTCDWRRWAGSRPPRRRSPRSRRRRRAAARMRRVVFDGVEHETPVLMRDRLAAGQRHEGPVVIEEESSTTVVPPGHVARSTSTATFSSREA